MTAAHSAEFIHHHHHHHISVMELGYLLTHSGLMYPEVSSKVCQFIHHSCKIIVVEKSDHHVKAFQYEFIYILNIKWPL